MPIKYAPKTYKALHKGTKPTYLHFHRNGQQRFKGGSEMDVGIQMIFSSYGWPGMSDREAWQEEIRLARLADELGFDVIWSVEHHFFDYAFCPDNTQLLSYLAPLCTHADLGTAAIILPWNDPLPAGGGSRHARSGVACL
jgi:hypothetical protein